MQFDVAGVPEVSIVIPCYNEEENVTAIHAAVSAAVSTCTTSHEIIFIDNKSTDGTRALLREICMRDPNARAIFNARNFGQMRSPTHAIYQAAGQAVIGMCADFQDPPALIPEFVARWRAGAPVVLGQRRSEETSATLRLARDLGYRLLGRYADYRVLPGVTGFGLYDRRVVDTLARWHEPEPFFRGMLVEGGYRIDLIPYDRPPRAAGTTKNDFAALFDFALSGLAGSSRGLLRAPIPFALYLAPVVPLLLLAALIAGIAGGLVWPWLLLAVQTGFFAVTLLILGLMGDQIRLLAERSRQTPLVIEEERLNFPPERVVPHEGGR